VAWLIIVIADAGLLVWGAMAVMAPDILRIGYESFTGRSWPELADTSPMTPEFITLLFRLLGAYNLAFGVLAIAIAAVALRHGDAWAWWALLVGNTIAFGAPMTYDQIVGAIGPFELLEYAATFGIYVALAVTAPLSWGGAVKPMNDLTGSAAAHGVPPLRPGARARRLGGMQIGVHVIKYIVAPLDRWLYRLTRGRILSTGRPIGPILLLTTTGRRTGKSHTTPVFYVREGKRLIICNVNPGFEHENPWTLNLRAHPVATVQVGRVVTAYRARVATEQEVERYWSHLVDIWPAYQVYYARGEQRVLFVLEPA